LSSAVVVDARYTTALAMIRSLGRAGVPVRAVERRGARGVLGFASRYAAEARRVAAPPADPVEALNALASSSDVVLPAALATTVALAGRTRELRARTVLPEPAALAAAVDKRRTLDAAAGAGVPVPREGGRSFPVVVKYRCGEALGLPPAERYAICRDAGERDAALAAMAARQGDPLVQEYLPGPGYGVACLFAPDGELVAAFCHRRLREYPPSGGPSCLAESVADAGLADLGVRTLRALGWRGLGMAEFRAGADGRPRLLEVNPRPWGTLALAIAAGVDFPLLWYRLAAGQPVEPVRSYREGVRLRYALKDLLSARAAGVGPLAFLRDAYAHPAVDAVFDPDDPLPGLVYLVRGLRA
jgi:predicted ATP-grasp superfamily ATP-dependent carboligase